MKADVIYYLSPISGYGRDRNANISKSGKTIAIHGITSRVTTDPWGSAASVEIQAEANAINAAQKALNARRKVLNERLCTSQASLIAAAKMAQEIPEATQEPIKLEPGML